MIPEDLPFRVIRVNSEDEILARATNLIIGRAAYETAVRMFPKDTIHYRNSAQVNCAERAASHKDVLILA
jgi:hypothetical protein